MSDCHNRNIIRPVLSPITTSTTPPSFSLPISSIKHAIYLPRSSTTEYTSPVAPTEFPRILDPFCIPAAVTGERTRFPRNFQVRYVSKIHTHLPRSVLLLAPEMQVAAWSECGQPSRPELRAYACSSSLSSTGHSGCPFTRCAHESGIGGKMLSAHLTHVHNDLFNLRKAVGEIA
ncbi:hypothetical protein EI94DRAFT_1737788 [Lactarius quietus]|nr:hypothetical protein EI94DRAFT_1737788 [Lactarius quietus]